MKKLFILLALLYSGVSIAQTTRIVDHNFNAPTGSHIYGTIQEAIDAANPGDTIQIQPSPNIYGNANITKKLTLVGIGFNVVKDIPYLSKMGSITLGNDPQNNTNSSGSVITGIEFTALNPGAITQTGYTLQDVKVYNCLFSYLYTSSSNANILNMEIYDCYITTSYTSGFCVYFGNFIDQSIFRNNVFLQGINFGSSSPGTNIITNNIIYGYIGVTATGTLTNIANNNFIEIAGSSAAFYTTFRNCLVNYNIFYGPTPSSTANGSGGTNFVDNIFTYNLLYQTGSEVMPPAGNTGIENHVANPEFTSVPFSSTWSSSNDYTLSSTSPALKANFPLGTPNSDIGITGGMYPWLESNFSLQTTALPVIEVLNTSTIINPGDSLSVQIKIKSN